MMLATRVIPVILTDGRCAVKPRAFGVRRPAGSVLSAARIYEARCADEIVLVDLDARVQGRLIDVALVWQVAESLFTPLAVGGGVRGTEDARALLAAGADKIVMGGWRREGIAEVARTLGCQAVVATLDAVAGQRGHVVYDYRTARETAEPVVEAAKALREAGAGEILLPSVDREGTRQGYDLDLVRAVAKTVSVSVIAHGGCGTPDHAVEAMRAGADAVAAASMFHFTGFRPEDVRRALAAAGYMTRSAA